MSSKLETLRADAAELCRLSQITDRQRVKDILSIEAKKLETEISRIQDSGTVTKSTPIAPISIKRCFDVKLTSYGWDQTDSLVKIFVQLPKVETLPSENIVCQFAEFAFELLVKELDNRNYVLSVKNLHSAISKEKCSWRIKTGIIILSLHKKSNNYWANLTKVEKEPKKNPKLDDDADPTAGIMNLMKQMYDDGDDEMKRTIAKAWTESREKNMNLDF